MSNSLAVAAVTATLQSILQHEVMTESDLSDLSVTIQPLDIARGKNTHNQLNLFLYMVVRNAAWSNADMPRQVQPGEVAIPPLALNLYYLLTAFGRDDDVAQPFGHELLGKAMSVLHDHPVLSAADIIAATQGALPGSDLAQQIERIRLTLHPLTIDELSKLWTGFAMQYRLSAAYEVDVALIDSTRAARAGLPVLTRGPGDQGVTAQSNLTPPVPTLTGLTLPKNQSSALLNDVVTLTGVHLDGSNIGVQFSHPLLAAPITVLPQPGRCRHVALGADTESGRPVAGRLLHGSGARAASGRDFPAHDECVGPAIGTRAHHRPRQRAGGQHRLHRDRDPRCLAGAERHADTGR